jgi:hypothetical protein
MIIDMAAFSAGVNRVKFKGLHLSDGRVNA